MSGFSNYIDRQKSGPGSSEKSQKVHSANWKEEIHLRKELKCLERQEQQRVRKLSCDQRLVVDKFYRRLSRSVDIAEKQEKAKESLPRNRQTQAINVEKQRRHVRCCSAYPKPPVPVFRKITRARSSSCEQAVLSESREKEKGYQLSVRPARPMTSLEKRNKLWEKQLYSVTQRINRARSAPARPAIYSVPEFSGATKLQKSNRKFPFQESKTVEFNSDMLRKLREKEVSNQSFAINEFLKTITPLELVPWTPFESETNVKEALTGLDNVLRTQNELLKKSTKKHFHRNVLYDLDHRLINTFESSNHES